MMLTVLGVLLLIGSVVVWLCLVVGLIRPRTFTFLFKDRSTRPVIALAFISTWIISGATGTVMVGIDQSSSTQTTQKAKKISPTYTIVEDRNTSHGAANRVTFWLKLHGDYDQNQMRQVIIDATNKHKNEFDIIWLRIVPGDATPNPEGFYGWRPVLASTKWISPSLDEQWHTTVAGPTEGDETVGGIVIAWGDQTTVGLTIAYLEQGEKKIQPPKQAPIKKEQSVQKQEPVKAKTITPKPAKSKPTFNPQKVIAQFKKGEIYPDAALLEWSRSDLGDGTERWLGIGETISCEVTPEYIHTFSVIGNAQTAFATLMIMGQVNAIVFPEDYKYVNQRILIDLIDLVSVTPDKTRHQIYKGFRLEAKKNTVLSWLTYKVEKEK